MNIYKKLKKFTEMSLNYRQVVKILLEFTFLEVSFFNSAIFEGYSVMRVKINCNLFVTFINFNKLFEFLTRSLVLGT